MKHFLINFALFCMISSILSCSKSTDNPIPANPIDTIQTPTTPTTPTTSIRYSYTFDSSFKSTGTFVTMGALQADGKIIVANNTQIARLNQDGTLDNSFTTGSTTKGEFHSLALQKDGKVLLGGSFTSYNNQSKSYYLRLNIDGSIDNDFLQLALTDYSSNPKVDIKSIALQSDNKIVLGGNFFYPTSVANGLSYGPKQIIRLNGNGSYDVSFQCKITALSVNCMQILADGKMLVTGTGVSVEYFTTSSSSEIYNYIVKLNTDGSLDPSFKWSAPNFSMVTPYTYLSAYGQSITVTGDGKILLGGRFETTSSVYNDNYKGLVRLNANGSLDNTLPKRGFDGVVSSLCLASDRIIIGTMHDPDKTYLNANVAILQVNKDGSDNDTYKVNNFTGYGDTYTVLEDENKNLLLFGKFYDKMAVAVYTFHGVIRLKKL